MLKAEKGLLQKTFTLPFVLMHLYLPFSDLRFIYKLFIKNDRRMMAVKNQYDISMSTIGMYFSVRRCQSDDFVIPEWPN